MICVLRPPSRLRKPFVPVLLILATPIYYFSQYLRPRTGRRGVNIKHRTILRLPSRPALRTWRRVDLLHDRGVSHHFAQLYLQGLSFPPGKAADGVHRRSRSRLRQPRELEGVSILVGFESPVFTFGTDLMLPPSLNSVIFCLPKRR